MVTTVRRGDVIIVELDPTRGSEQLGTRPCLVVQTDVGNENAPTSVVVRAESGADLFAHRDAVDLMAGPDEFLARERAFFCPDLSRKGLTGGRPR